MADTKWLQIAALLNQFGEGWAPTEQLAKTNQNLAANAQAGIQAELMKKAKEEEEKARKGGIGGSLGAVLGGLTGNPLLAAAGNAAGTAIAGGKPTVENAAMAGVQSGIANALMPAAPTAPAESFTPSKLTLPSNGPAAQAGQTAPAPQLQANQDLLRAGAGDGQRAATPGLTTPPSNSISGALFGGGWKPGSSQGLLDHFKTQIQGGALDRWNQAGQTLNSIAGVPAASDPSIPVTFKLRPAPAGMGYQWEI